jgi:hypothetical protein
MPARHNGTSFKELAPFLGLRCIRKRLKFYPKLLSYGDDIKANEASKSSVTSSVTSVHV